MTEAWVIPGGPYRGKRGNPSKASSFCDYQPPGCGQGSLDTSVWDAVSQGRKIQGIDDPTIGMFRDTHRVGRILSIFSNRQNWNSPTSSPAAECGGGAHLLAGEGVGSTNSDEGTYTVILYIYVFCGETFFGDNSSRHPFRLIIIHSCTLHP
jgi:hypothetical protein